MPISVMPYLAQCTCHGSLVQDTRVPLEQHVARDLLPPGEGGHRQGRRPANHQPLVLRTLKPKTLPINCHLKLSQIFIKFFIILVVL